MIHITAPLAEVNTEYRGTNNFTVTQVRVDLGRERQLELRANGPEGDRVAAVLGQAPQGAYVTLFARPVFREYNSRAYFDLEIVDCVLQGSFGTVDTGFRLQGFVTGVTKKEGPRGPFYVANLTLVAFGRDGMVPNANVDMTIGEELLPAWQSAVGKYAIVSGTVSGYTAANGRIYPRFAAQGISGIIEVPSWLREHAPQAAAPVEPATAVAVSSPVPF
jgi:hypothetical protein